MVRSLEGKHPQYYEAILQLRDVASDVVDFVNKEIMIQRIPVSKKDDVRNGSDYYLADSNFARSLGTKLQHRFGGEMIITSTLHTKKQGKDLYRITVLFRVAPFRKYDKVEYQGEEFDVKAMAKDIVLQNTKTGKKVRVKYKEMNAIKKLK